MLGGGGRLRKAGSPVCPKQLKTTWEEKATARRRLTAESTQRKKQKQHMLSMPQRWYYRQKEVGEGMAA